MWSEISEDQAMNDAVEQRARKYTILIVDDEEAVRRVLKRWLEKAGHEVHEAANGKEALALIEAGVEYGLIITDLNMPEMDGIELLKRIHTKIRVPKLIHSATIVADKIQFVLEQDGLITSKKDPAIIGKPCPIKEFYATVESLLEEYERYNEKSDPCA